MTIYRHCECVYYQSWHRTTPTRPGRTTLEHVGPNVSLKSSVQSTAQQAQRQSQGQSHPAEINKALGRLQIDGRDSPVVEGSKGPGEGAPAATKRGLPFDEEAKLIYGVLFSLRSMVKKLSGKEDELFVAYKTSTYKLHLFETPTGYKFVLFSDPLVESLRFVLKSIYQSAFIDFVVRNPMVEMDSKANGSGIDNQAFRTAVNNFVSSLSVFR